MRVLILGGDGMLGHRLYLHMRGRHEVKVTLRLALPAYTQYELFNTANTYDVVDAVSFGSVRRAVEDYEPQVLVNAIGIVKQRNAASQAVPSIEVNALFPHRLAVLCRGHGIRLIHISTDCVFSGRRGNYNEGNMPDATDLYGRSKLLGEVTEGNAITLRTSMVGRELTRKASLIEWFLSQTGSVKGYRRAIFSGFTTHELARVIERLIVEFPDAAGLYHVSSEPISKYDLLRLVRDRMRRGVEIRPDDTFQCDRSLDSTLFRTRFSYQPPTWEAMVDELAQDRRP
jgi:dTDP-4-dehydrorhamnose reductase